jgi:hypothetical protein
MLGYPKTRQKNAKENYRAYKTEAQEGKKIVELYSRWVSLLVIRERIS